MNKPEIYHWRTTKNGYNKTIRIYKGSTGEIVGHVEGSAQNGWCAVVKAQTIGTYATQRYAKKAVKGRLV